MLCTSVLPFHSALMCPILFSTASPSLIRLLIALIKEQLNLALNTWSRPCQGYIQVLSGLFCVGFVYLSLTSMRFTSNCYYLPLFLGRYPWATDSICPYAQRDTRSRSLDPLKQPTAQGRPTPLPWGGTNFQDAVYTLGFPKGSAENRILPASVPLNPSFSSLTYFPHSFPISPGAHS